MTIVYGFVLSVSSLFIFFLFLLVDINNNEKKKALNRHKQQTTDNRQPALDRSSTNKE